MFCNNWKRSILLLRDYCDIPFGLSRWVCLQAVYCKDQITVHAPLIISLLRPQHIWSVWLNNLFIPFLPDLQASEGPLVEEIGRDWGIQKTLGKKSGNGRGEIKMFRFSSPCPVLICNVDYHATLKGLIVAQCNGIITKECTTLPVLFYYNKCICIWMYWFVVEYTKCCSGFVDLVFRWESKCHKCTLTSRTSI